MGKLTLKEAQEKEENLVTQLHGCLNEIEELALCDDNLIIDSVEFNNSKNYYNSFNTNNHDITMQLMITIKHANSFVDEDEADNGQRLQDRAEQILKDYKEYCDMLYKEREFKPSDTDKASTLHKYFNNSMKKIFVSDGLVK
ncbi:hypothetical protein [Staphylococcus delphini]|uniref:Phage protein n=1 Tax=Staphylococcus delphini TaxID=53344 RepID=A0AAX0QSF8_9STAP|nr:hypothetical protein [Staphylococcus delphini]PCF50060.1 hypothetical protein B5C07_07575 [Staphylococcus delphini]PNZ95682.1 hypothetical protein CD148_03115 [Staphylococcus delphini]RIZ56308.1 hypothetical protein CDL68_01850 [Staphylococcus delphini]VED62548.1 Uncharacterised protein [Staphylococcus delphini]